MRNFSLLFAFLVVLLLLSCATRRSTSSVELAQLESANSNYHASFLLYSDTTIVHDTVRTYISGDTVRDEIIRDRYHVIHDVVRDTIHDTIRMRVLVTKTYEKTREVVPFAYKCTIVTLLLPLIFMLYNMFCKKSPK